MCITSTSRAVDRSTSQTTATIQTGGYCNLHFFGLLCWYLNWESWASSNPNQPVMTSQFSTHFEKLQLRHVHLGAGAAWKQISAWKCRTCWGLLKMMPYEFLNLHVDHRWSNFSRWTSSCFFSSRGGAIPKSAGFVCASAHTLSKLATLANRLWRAQKASK